ncbi:MAG: hypothetical protein D6742_13690 [Cyanobacteria bacterium J069]|nr:MAG: hypothetical protein D6742_13690 [Cyanobacteria bacterium J069]
MKLFASECILTMGRAESAESTTSRVFSTITQIAVWDIAAIASRMHGLPAAVAPIHNEGNVTEL